MRPAFPIFLLSTLALASCHKNSAILQPLGVAVPQPRSERIPSVIPAPAMEEAPAPQDTWPSTHPGRLSSLTAGEHHSCALLDGQVYCWGYGLTGQLGQNDNQNYAEPVAVQALGNDNVAVHAGALHTCAIKQSGQVYCWGYNQTGAIGNGRSGREYSFSGQAKLYNVTNPTLVLGLDGIRIVQIAATKTTTCGLDASGDVYCWGSGSSYELGDHEKDEAANRLAHHSGMAQKVTVLNEKAREIHAGDRAFCAVTESGRIQCWGTLTLPLEQAYPWVDLSPSQTPRSLAMADQHLCFVTEDNQLFCMGDNWYQQSGLSRITNIWTLVRGEWFAKVSTARKTTCGITPDGKVRCWGVCLYGLCGEQYAAQLVSPTQPQNVFAYSTQKSIGIMGISGALEIAVGARHACALLDTGRIKCWGSGFLGELGHGESQDSARPVDVHL